MTFCISETTPEERKPPPAIYAYYAGSNHRFLIYLTGILPVYVIKDSVYFLLNTFLRNFTKVQRTK